MTSGKDTEERRGVLKVLATLGGLACAGVVVVPCAELVASTPGGARGATWVKIAMLADLAQGVPKRFRVVGDRRDAFTLTKGEELGAVWLVREGASVRALSAACPHLGCAIDLHADQKSFDCPCHDSTFRLDGACQSGPSPRGMDPLDARVTGGAVEIAWRRFRMGIAEREEAG